MKVAEEPKVSLASSKFSSKFFPLTVVSLECFILDGHATFIRRDFLLLLMFALGHGDMRRPRAEKDQLRWSGWDFSDESDERPWA